MASTETNEWKSHAIMSMLPLEGLVVVDFSRVLAGPLATASLADLGARVVKVERPGGGDDTRAWGPPWTANSSAYFHACNRNKESVVLDLTDDADLQVARELSARADVFVENFRTGVLERFELGYEQVRAANPGVIYCSITGFGSDRGASMPGYDFLVQAVGGLMSVTGDPRGAPTKVGVALVDVLASKDAVTGILAALHARARDGLGQRIEINLLSTLLAALVNQASAWSASGRVPGRMGNAHPSIAPYELLQCRDEAIAVACGNDSQFGKLTAVLGEPELAQNQRFDTNERRVEHRDELRVELERLLASASAESWATSLLAAGVPAGRVGSVADAFALAASLGLEPLIDVGDGLPAQVRHPVQFSRTPVTRYEAPPTLGHHSDAIRRWLNQEEGRS